MLACLKAQAVDLRRRVTWAFLGRTTPSSWGSPPAACRRPAAGRVIRC